MTPRGETRTDGRQSRWDAHNAERRAQVLEAAVELVEEQGAGAPLHVQEIAARAGMSRTVLYRHFDDRADLDHAVQERVVALLRERLDPQVSLEGSIEGIILRIVTAYVSWAAAHPELHRLIERSAPGDVRPLALHVTVNEMARQVNDLVLTGAELLEVHLPADQQAALDPFVFGIVGQAFATVGRWIGRPVLEPGADVFAVLLARSVWSQIDGHLRAIGVEIDPTVPVEELALLGVGRAAPSRRRRAKR